MRDDILVGGDAEVDGCGSVRLGPVDGGGSTWPFGSLLPSSSEKRSGSAIEDSMSMVFVREEKKRIISPKWKQSHA